MNIIIAIKMYIFNLSRWVFNETMFMDTFDVVHKCCD